LGRFEILEHTADVGVRAFGDDLAETFETATRGLTDICGTWAPGSGESVDLTVESDDVEAALVDWLNEILWLQDSRDVVLTAVSIERVDRSGVSGRVSVAPRDRELEGTAVKAATYHQLAVTRADDGWVAQVYLDV
jgi:SHS2 domain-containing protein